MFALVRAEKETTMSGEATALGTTGTTTTEQAGAAQAAVKATEAAAAASAGAESAAQGQGGEKTATVTAEDLDFQIVGFDDETAPTEDELRGVEPPEEKPKDAPGTEQKAESSPPEGTKGEKTEDGAAKPEGDAKAKAEGEKEGAKPPEGYVPLAALHEARTKIKAKESEAEALRAEVNQLRQQAQARPQPQAVRKVAIPEDMRADVATFEQSFPMLKGLVRADSPEGQRLRDSIRDLGPSDISTVALAETYATRVEQTRRDHEARQEESRALKAQADAFVSGCLSEMEEIVPGLFDENSGAALSLIEAAKGAGLDPELLAPLTDPYATIAVPDGKGGFTSNYLGKAAVMLKSASEAAKPAAAGTAFSKEDVEKAKAEAVADALKKLKIPEARFTALGASPRSGGEGPGEGGRILNEDELAKLSPKDMEAYLRGAL
jgi:hypothetical protein